jgi:hypothetical protein
MPNRRNYEKILKRFRILTMPNRSENASFWEKIENAISLARHHYIL